MSEPLRDPDKDAEEAAWREIVAHFGERAQLPEEPTAPEVDFGDDVDEAFDADVALYEDAYDSDERRDDDPDRFVPPRPSLPHTTPERFLAWLGVLGAPVVAVLLVVVHMVLHWWIPTWVVAALVIAFLGGFGYLVLAMPKEPRDPWDDGARL